MGGNLHISNIENILLGDPDIVTIHYPKEYEIPKINYGLWIPDKIKYQKKNIKIFTDYLNLPCIEDKFGSDHNKRGSWHLMLLKKDKKVFEYIHNDALRQTNIFKVNFVLELLTRDGVYIGTNSKKLDNLIKKTNNILKEKYKVTSYNQLLTKDKLQYVNDLKESIYKILAFLSKQTVSKKKKTKN